MKNTPSKLLFSNSRIKRNMWLFDAGLHTLNMKMEENESDVEFVERFLVKFFNGCRNRGGKKYKYYLMDHIPDNDYITVWGVK